MAPTMVSGDRLTSGHRMSHPAPGDDGVFITGISGYFPDSDSVMHLQENLFNKVDLVSGDDRRWKLSHPEIPQRTGKINHIEKFDASFFGVHFKETHTIDPMCRTLMEKTYEAIIDAGVNPQELRNTKTGVFIGSCFSESENTWWYEKMQVNEFGIAGCSRAMLANRISNWLGVTGPSYTIDSGCSSSLYAFEHAFKAIRDGHCDAAIVGGSNLCLHPYVSMHFFRLGALSPDGTCNSFDNSANGYARSEAVVVCFLQKAKDSRRVYAQVVHAKTNCDGYKEQGISYPSGDMQRVLISEFYEECSIQPSALEYLEAHGTGTKAGDPVELNVIGDIFCTGRSDPLMIGSVKSNLGHSEPASGLCSIAKLCIAYTTGYIPPNINYKVPKEGVPALKEGKLKVVTEKQPWGCGMSGVNSFGFGGANAHILLKNVARPKVNDGIPSDDLPRLICVSGRTESAVAKILDDLESKTVDVDLVRLLHAIHDNDIKGHFTRGYTLLGSTLTKSVLLARNIQHFNGAHRPVCFVYSGMGSHWVGIASQLMRVPVFSAAIDKCHKALTPRGINLKNLIMNSETKLNDNILNSFIGIAAIQIGLTDVLKAVGIEPDFIIGHGLGELGCAYSDDCLTAEQMILSAYYVGLASIETPNIKGSMAVVSLGYNHVKLLLPPELEVACQNGPNSSTITGPANIMRTFVAKLVTQGIYAKDITCYNIAYHSRYIAEVGPRLLQYLKQVIPAPKQRSERWLSTSIQQTSWNDHEAEMSSAEYHTNNFLSPVLFEATARLIPENAITIEIAPHDFLQTILSGFLKKDLINISLTESNQDNVQVLFTALGELYIAGLNPLLANVYPTINFPVSQGTPMLSHLVEWDHIEDWYVTSYETQTQMKSGERTVKMSIYDENYDYMVGHVIDGRNLYPATGYILMVWENLAMMMGKLLTEVSVVFENVRFQRATNIPKGGKLEFIVTIQRGSGQFEVVESGASIVTGRIYARKNIGQEYCSLPVQPESTEPNDNHLLTKDFYKELRLRGYQYSGLFRGVLGCNVEGTRGRLAWVENWVTFIDCMLQMKIIGEDTRGLFVPTRIEKLSIDVNMHYDALSKMNPDSTKKSFEIRAHPYIDSIRAGGVEIRGLHAAPISRRTPLGVPVLEKNVFIPNYGKSKMKIEDILRSNIQLVLENIQIYKVKSIEIVDDQYKTNELEPILDKVADVLGDLPLIQADLTVISEDSIEMPSKISVENKKLTGENNNLIIIGANLLQRPEVLKNALAALRDKGFIMSREIKPINPKDFSDKYDIITMYNTGFEYIVLFRKRVGAKLTKFVKIDSADQTYAWIDKIKDELEVGQKVVVYSQDDCMNGLLGLINCLKKEPCGYIIYGLLISDPSAPSFNPDLEFYEEQLDKDLTINVYQEGQWGTYRHLLLGDLDTVQSHHAFVNTVTIGDLSSLSWLEGPIRENTVIKNPDSILINVYSAALNFRDVMTATGRLSLNAIAKGRLAQECVQGFEVVGRTCNGTRVMAMVRNSGTSNMVIADKEHWGWGFPDEWTFEEAATVPVAYGTVYYALIMVGNMQRGESILIHAGSGGVGQAAINVALRYGCEVFTTVGTPEKRAFIKRLFPQLKDSHIGNSRDTSFEDMVRKETNGKGVDVVLNSLADEKLQASIRCLGYRGRFLEIGKFDIFNNTLIGMYLFLNEISFHGITLDSVFDESYEFRKTLQDLLLSGIESGAVRPLTHCTFEKNQIESAFRYMAAGKHIGKVIVKIRDEERSSSFTKPKSIRMEAVPRYICDELLVYIVVGGLGGFGLELVDWLIMRGARKVLLSSRRGISNGYQLSRLRAWAGYGADVQVSTHDVTTEDGCKQMLKMANSMGAVEAIFNLAVILKDCLFENQTPESFRISFAPKAQATMNLDKLSQKMCPKLKDFVIFSSVSCGRGNIGQTNYGFSNSVMERICEKRKELGLPALAVQWGAVGDVGLVADMQDEDVLLEIGGTLQQRISSCLLCLDKFLKQDAVIVSSIVVAEKKVGDSGCGSIVDAVAQIIGVMDLQRVSHQVPLAQLGMDSMMAVEIKQTLEREYEIFLTAPDIRNLTFARLVELTAQKDQKAPTSASVQHSTPVDDDYGDGIQLLLRNVGEEITASEPFIYMPSLVSDGHENDVVAYEKELIMFMLPGIEGFASGMATLCRWLKIKTCVLQFTNNEEKLDTLDTLVNRLHKIVKSRLVPGHPYILLGYSFGTLPMLKLASLLESEGHNGTIFCLDGSPDYLYATLNNTLSVKSDTQLQNSLICKIINMVAAKNVAGRTLMKKLEEIESYEERIKYTLKLVPEQIKFSDKFIQSIGKACFDRFKMIINRAEFKKIKAPIVLLRPKKNPRYLQIEENYSLNKLTYGSVTVHFVDGDHTNITENKDCANIINRFLAKQDITKTDANVITRMVE